MYDSFIVNIFFSNRNKLGRTEKYQILYKALRVKLVLFDYYQITKTEGYKTQASMPRTYLQTCRLANLVVTESFIFQ